MISDKAYRTARPIPGINNLFRRVVFKLPHRRRLVEHFGQQLWVDPSEMHGFYLDYERAYDDYIFDFITSRRSRFSRVLDIGANIGIYTVFFASHFGRVDAFEPDAANLKRLKDNFTLNRITNVEVHPVCITDHVGSVSFVPGVDHNQGIGSISTEMGAVQVPCVTLDHFFGDSVPEPSLLKVDIEGVEWLAFRGAKRLLTNYARKVSILLEVHPERLPAYGGTALEMKKFFENYGMAVQALTEDGLRPVESPDKDRFWWISHFENQN